jgi:hypothetical protein
VVNGVAVFFVGSCRDQSPGFVHHQIDFLFRCNGMSIDCYVVAP